MHSCECNTCSQTETKVCKRESDYDIDTFPDNIDNMILKLLDSNGLLLGDMSNRIRDNNFAVRIAVKNNGLSLRFASERICDNRCIVSMAVSKNPYAIKYASDTLKNDIKFATEITRKYPVSYAGFGDIVMYNEEIILQVIGLNPSMIQYVPIECLNNKKVAMVSVSGCPDGLLFLNPSFLYNKKIVLKALESDGSMLQYVSDVLRDDFEVVRVAVLSDCESIKFASFKMRNNKDIAKIVLCHDGSKLGFFSDYVRSDGELVLLALKTYRDAVGFASDGLRNDYTFMLQTIMFDSSNVSYVSESLLLDTRFRMKLFSENYGICLDVATLDISPIVYSKNADLMLKHVEYDGCLLRYACDSLKNNKRIVMAAIHNNIDAIKYTRDTVRSDSEIVSILSRHRTYISFASDAMKSNVILFENLKNIPSDIGFYRENIRDAFVRDSAFYSVCTPEYLFLYGRSVSRAALRLVSMDMENIYIIDKRLLYDKRFVAELLKLTNTSVDWKSFLLDALPVSIRNSFII
jgi:hypothetical protein